MHRRDRRRAAERGGTTGVIEVLLVDDEELVRSGLRMIRMILRNADDIDVVGEARDGAEAVDPGPGGGAPDVILLDIRMPGVDGLAALAELVALPRPPAVVMPTTFSMDEYVHRALRAGARGFLLKDAPVPAQRARFTTATRCWLPVKAHVSRSLAKLGMNNRVQAAILSHAAGWV
jgi:DNA-binding NarL/FixJ family response regulator